MEEQTNRIVALEKTIGSKDTEIAQKNEELAAKDAEIAANMKQPIASAEQSTVKGKELARSQTVVKLWGGLLASSLEVMKRLELDEEELMEKDKELVAKDRELSEKDKELAEKDKKLDEKDEGLAEKSKGPAVNGTTGPAVNGKKEVKTPAHEHASKQPCFRYRFA